MPTCMYIVDVYFLCRDNKPVNVSITCFTFLITLIFILTEYTDVHNGEWYFGDSQWNIYFVMRMPFLQFFIGNFIVSTTALILVYKCIGVTCFSLSYSQQHERFELNMPDL